MGRDISTQGPEGTISSKSRRSLEILKDSLTYLGNHVSLISPDYHKVLLLASTLTLVVENFFSKMRSSNDMPTVLEFAHLFAPTIRESLKQLTDTGFAYHTSSSAHYEAPDEMKLSFRELPTIPSMPSVLMAKEKQKLMRDWRDSYGKPVRQLTVRNQNTKDNVGTRPLYAYTAPDPAAKPVDFSVIVQDTATNGDRQNSQVRQEEIDPGATSDQVLFKENEVLILKPDHVRGLSSASNSFFVGTVIDVVTVENSPDHTQLFF